MRKLNISIPTSWILNHWGIETNSILDRATFPLKSLWILSSDLLPRRGFHNRFKRHIPELSILNPPFPPGLRPRRFILILKEGGEKMRQDNNYQLDRQLFNRYEVSLDLDEIAYLRQLKQERGVKKWQ